LGLVASVLLLLENQDQSKPLWSEMKVFLLLVLFTSQAFSYVDFNLGYTYSIKNIDGIETEAEPDPGSAQTTSTGYQANWAWYMWEYTALEFNFSSTTQRLVDDREVVTSDGNGLPVTIKKIDSSVVTEVSGVGIRQAFAGRKARIIPALAIGYAKYTTSGSTKYTFDFDGTLGETESIQEPEVYSSSYLTFSLRFRITQLVGLTLAAKAVMPEFETKEANNNMTYSAGFSWVF
jgi:hypothetical protein